MDDPRLTPCLHLDPLSHAESNGVEAYYRPPVVSGVAAELSVRYQESRTDRVAANGAPGPSGPIGMFPRWQESVRIYLPPLAGLQVSVETIHVGTRTLRTADQPNAPGVLKKLPETCSANMYIRRTVSDRTMIYVYLYQFLGPGSFYTTYPTRTSVVGGFSFRL